MTLEAMQREMAHQMEMSKAPATVIDAYEVLFQQVADSKTGDLPCPICFEQSNGTVPGKLVADPSEPTELEKVHCIVCKSKFSLPPP